MAKRHHSKLSLGRIKPMAGIRGSTFGAVVNKGG
jgi:hypothetical protein